MRALIAGAFTSCAMAVMAQQDVSPSADAVKSPQAQTMQTVLKYAYGLKIKSPDLTSPGRDAKILPVLALTYGRWRLGYNADPDAILGLSGVVFHSN